MGVDVTLLPVSYESDNGELVCDHAFNLDLNAVVGLVLELPKLCTYAAVYWPIAQLPDEIVALLPDCKFRGPWESPYQNPCFGRSEEKDHRYVFARDIKRVWETRGDVLDEANDSERAAFAYIGNLDEATKVLINIW